MITRRILLGAIAIFVAALTNPLRMAMAADNCQLTVPPLESAVLENHALFFFVFPRTLGADYTGCQIIWDEKGAKMWSTKFDHGRTVEFDSENWNGETGFSCLYVDSKLASGDPKRCPEYDRIKEPLVTGPREEDLPVPPERDPRR